jgi:hypothetical protein
MIIHRDNQNQPFVEWQHIPPGGGGNRGFRRAWIRHPATADKDWAGTGRYVNVAPIGALGGGPAGQSADFPIFNDLPDDQVLIAFVAAVCGVTGCQIP